MSPKCLAAGLATVALFAACLVFAALPDQELEGVNALMSAELATGPLRMPLNQDYLIVRGPGAEQRRVPVILVANYYRFQALQVREGKPGLWGHHLSSYEIRAVGEDELFAWNMWSLHPLGMFRLFSNEGGQNYLAWVDRSTVCFAEVTQPRDRVVALTEALSVTERPAWVVRVPTNRLIDSKHHGRDVFYSELVVEALDIAEAGHITAKISALRTGKLFNIVFDGKEWRKQ